MGTRVLASFFFSNGFSKTPFYRECTANGAMPSKDWLLNVTKPEEAECAGTTRTLHHQKRKQSSL